MNRLYLQKQIKRPVFFVLVITAFSSVNIKAVAQTTKPVFQYTVSITDPGKHYFHVELNSSGWFKETVDIKMPKWMPGYYQLMNYAKAVENFSAKDKTGKSIPVKMINDNTWQISISKKTAFTLSYDVKTERQFVATSFIDSSHAYIVPAGLFMYADGFIKNPVSVKINSNKQWNKIATGLEPVPGKSNEFSAPDFDILYDCPLLIGNLEELPPFKVNGIVHRFIGYKMGGFDRVQFMNNLQKVVKAAVAVIDDIPYKEYTFIGIGPGRGGIEHLNNTTVSFDGKGLNTESGMNTTMIFLAHEYFHHYNVKRIRPLELGPFDYDKENRTNLLWVSEGLSVYYEYMIAKRAGVINEQTLFKNFEKSINAVENNPGRLYQSLTQASYETWGDGPFGKQGKDAGKTISYYDKGPVIGLILDLAIRHASQNKRSLDDVMRFLYFQYYKKLQRGFTDAEFQQACETQAGISLSSIFENVYTTKEIDYETYLQYAGLKSATEINTEKAIKIITIHRSDEMNSEQSNILQSWLDK